MYTEIYRESDEITTLRYIDMLELRKQKILKNDKHIDNTDNITKGPWTCCTQETNNTTLYKFKRNTQNLIVIIVLNICKIRLVMIDIIKY